MVTNGIQRRFFIKNTALSFFGITTIGYAGTSGLISKTQEGGGNYFYRYPGIHDELVSAVVGAAHFNLDRVKELVSQRPELACATWDWGFGDFESALGAASHVGRRDIAEYLIDHGARPDIFTYTMLGMLRAVQEIIENIPGLQSHSGPHGITLLAHAKNRLSNKDITGTEIAKVTAVMNYLESLGNADAKPVNLEITEAEKQMYMGEYRYGELADEVLVANLNSSNKFLQLGRKNVSGRRLNKVDDHVFSPAGAPSVKIIFKMKDNKAVALSIHEPEPLVTATRI